MKDYIEEIKPGLKIIYDGKPIEYANVKTGKIVEVVKRGKYIVTRVTNKKIYFKSDRKNAVTEHYCYKNEMKIKVLEWDDLTTLLFWTFNHPEWIINDEELIRKAKKYNQSRQ